MAFCPKCGKEVSADAAFCPACGASLHGSAAKSPNQVQVPSSPGGMLDFARSRNASYGVLISGLVIILDIIAVAVAFVQLSAGVDVVILSLVLLIVALWFEYRAGKAKEPNAKFASRVSTIVMIVTLFLISLGEYLSA